MNVRSFTRTLTLCSALIGSTSAALAQLTRTPETTEGPYYIFNSTQRLDTAWLVNADNDLTQVATSSTRASVSARSTVGAADSMLIAGFVIQGTGTKRLLIRAVGPKLSEFGVTGVLSDPKLEIFNAAGTVVSSNDDWASTLATTFTQAAAFALNTGSKDAALVVTLPAGASYTAVVSGVNGATGEAMVEIYDLQ